MTRHPYSYELYFKLIEKFSLCGYRSIDYYDPLILELEELTQKNDQFFYIADLIEIKILWSSSRSLKMMGIKPEELNPYNIFEATHPDDIERHGKGRSQMFSLANDIYIAEQGSSVLSTNLRMRNLYGNYPDLLLQLYMFYSQLPYKSVYLLTVLTNLDPFIRRKHGHHYYVGNIIRHFRYPDDELLGLGHPFTDREFEIISLIKEGFSSEQIAEKLFLSVHTVNTHRKNILSKVNLKHLPDLIIDLVSRRVL
jgi:DNA-binding CsgD family transcriptional regulator